MPTSDYPTASSVTDFALLGQLFEDYRPRLLAMLQRRIDVRLAVRVAPEDVLSDAFVDARRKWPQFRDSQGFSAYAWLYRIVYERLIETWRSQSRGPRDLRRDMPWPEESSIMMGLSLVNAGTSPGDAFARSELREQMKHALSLLKEHDREVLSLRQYEDMTFGEIGEVLGLTENAATVRYVRALKKLKKCWQALHPESTTR